MLNEERNKYLNKFEDAVVRNCPKCFGSGEACSCWDDLNLEYRCLDAQIPLEHLPLRLENINHPDLEGVKKKIEKYIDNLDENVKQGKGLLLYGDHGTGKTSFGAMILREVMRTRADGTQHECYFTNLEDCVNMIAGGWRSEAARAEFEEKILNVKMLLLDDVGGLEIKTGNNGLLIQSTFTSLFKERSSNLRPTIITSNLNPEALQNCFGARIYSVMMQRLDFIKFNTKFDYRQDVLSDNTESHIIKPKGFTS